MENKETKQQGATVNSRCQCGELPDDNFSTTVYCLVMLGILPEFMIDSVDWDEVAYFLKTHRTAN